MCFALIMSSAKKVRKAQNELDIVRRNELLADIDKGIGYRSVSAYGSVTFGCASLYFCAAA